MKGLEHAPIVFGHDLDELRRGLGPESQELPSPPAVSIYRMTLEHLLNFLQVSFVEAFKRNRFEVAAVLEAAVLIEHVGDST